MRPALAAVAFVATALLGSPALSAAPKFRPEAAYAAAFSKPDVGTEVEVEIGQAVASAGRVTPALEVTEPTSGKTNGNTVLIPRGFYKLVARSDDGSFFQGMVPPISVRAFGITGTWPDGGVYIPDEPTKPSGLYYRSAIGWVFYKDLPGLKYRLLENSDLSGGFRRELLYAGVAKGVITLSYREFSNDMARPAFTQALSYDLADGDEIGFRGARIKVVKATNTTIRYVVLKPLDPS